MITVRDLEPRVARHSMTGSRVAEEAHRSTDYAPLWRMVVVLLAVANMCWTAHQAVTQSHDGPSMFALGGTKAISVPIPPEVPESTAVVVGRGTGGFKLGAIATELGVVVITQSIGLPLLGRIAVLTRRIPWAAVVRSGHRLSPILGRMLQGFVRAGVKVSKSFGRHWKSLMTYYKKTSASKVVTRTKKMVKIYQHHNESDEHEHEEAQDDHDGHHE
jgi:hypothetical protein